MARYDAFLLRVWRRAGEDGDQWAGRLEYLPAGLSLRFTDLDSLLIHLRAALDHGSDDPRGLGVEDPIVATDEKGVY
jgi:hypothetical protein